MDTFWGAFLGGLLGAIAACLAGIGIGLVYVYIKRLQLQKAMKRELSNMGPGGPGVGPGSLVEGLHRGEFPPVPDGYPPEDGEN